MHLQYNKIIMDYQDPNDHIDIMNLQKAYKVTTSKIMNIKYSTP